MGGDKLFLWPYLLVGIGLILFAEIVLGSTPLMVIGILVFIVAPLIFNSQFRSGFTKKARLQFFPDHLIIELINKDTDAVERTDDFQFDQVASFRTGDSSRDDSSFISLQLTDGRKFNYSFLEQRPGVSAHQLLSKRPLEGPGGRSGDRPFVYKMAGRSVIELWFKTIYMSPVR